MRKGSTIICKKDYYYLPGRRTFTKGKKYVVKALNELGVTFKDDEDDSWTFEETEIKLHFKRHNFAYGK